MRHIIALLLLSGLCLTATSQVQDTVKKEPGKSSQTVEDTYLKLSRRYNNQGIALVATGVLLMTAGLGLVTTGIILEDEISKNRLLTFVGIGGGLLAIGLPLVIPGSIKLTRAKRYKRISKQAENKTVSFYPIVSPAFQSQTFATGIGVSLSF